MSKPIFRTQEWINRLNFAALASWLVMSLVLASMSYVWYGVDFRGYFVAARVLIAGGNPYDYHLVSRELLSITGEMGNNPYYYSPWFAWFFIPLTAFPFQIARAIWMGINVVIWNVGLWQLGMIFNWPQAGWRRYVLFLLSTFSFAWITWRYEQAGILIFAMLVATIISIQKQRWVWTGIWLALLLIKPNITLLVVAGICLWLAYKRFWRPIVIMVLALFSLLIVSTWMTPDWYVPFSEDGFGQGLQMVLDGPDRIVALRINTTFLDWLSTINVKHSLQPPVYVAVILVGIIIFFWTVFRSKTILELAGTLLLISYGLTPYALQYDYPPLVIVLFWELSLCAPLSPKALRTGLFFASFVLSVIFWQQNISWAYWMVVGLIVFRVWELWLFKINETS